MPYRNQYGPGGPGDPAAVSAEGVRNRQIRMSARRLAAVQTRVLSDASRSGQISDEVARKLARHIDIELEEHPSEPKRPLVAILRRRHRHRPRIRRNISISRWFIGGCLNSEW